MEFILAYCKNIQLRGMYSIIFSHMYSVDEEENSFNVDWCYNFSKLNFKTALIGHYALNSQR